MLRSPTTALVTLILSVDGAYPSVDDGEVSKTVCFTYTPTSCKVTKGIFVKNCGSYFIHKLFKPPGRGMRYCGTN